MVRIAVELWLLAVLSRGPYSPFLAHSNNFMNSGRLSINDQEREEAFSTLGSLGSGVWQAWGSSTAAEVKDLCIVIRHVCDFCDSCRELCPRKVVPKDIYRHH